jgi:hypothetical protein
MRLVYTRERKHIGKNGQGSLALLSRWLLLKVLKVGLEDSQSCWHLTIATENKQLQKNK